MAWILIWKKCFLIIIVVSENNQKINGGSKMITVYCPIRNDRIDGIDCNIVCDIVDGLLNVNVLPQNIEWNEKNKEACLNCKYHNAVENAILDDRTKIVFFKNKNGKTMASLDVAPDDWEFFEIDEKRIRKTK